MTGDSEPCFHALDIKITNDQNRIVQLEAELAAAQRLIASQRQVLQSNIEANIVDDEGNPAAPLEENVLPPLKPMQTLSYPDKRPLKLPEFGASTGDMAQRVFQAAAAQGIINGPPLQSPSNSREHTPRAASEPNDEPTLPPSNPKRELSRSLLVSAALLLGAVLTVGLRSIHASPPSQNIHSLSQTSSPYAISCANSNTGLRFTVLRCASTGTEHCRAGTGTGFFPAANTAADT